MPHATPSAPAGSQRSLRQVTAGAAGWETMAARSLALARGLAAGPVSTSAILAIVVLFPITTWFSLDPLISAYWAAGYLNDRFTPLNMTPDTGSRVTPDDDKF